MGGVCTPDKWDTSGVNIVCDIINMPLADKSIDAILCSEVFEHLKDPVLAIKEFSRIMRKGGKLILTAPFCSLTHMAPYYYGNGFSEYWYKAHLMEHGFEIEEIIPYGNYFKYLNQELFRVNEMAKRYCEVELKEEEIKNIADSIRILSYLSASDKGSSEILCFGYMIVASKI